MTALFSVARPLVESNLDTTQVQRVLIAEDVAVNRELVRLMLEPMGFVVDEVDDGDKALQAVIATRYDFVLMDMQMPFMDGVQATRAIRALGGEYARLPIIGLSANVIADQVARCLEAGMSAHLAKPFKADDLRQTLSSFSRQSLRPRNRTLNALAAQAGRASVSKLLQLLLQQVQAFEACEETDRTALRSQVHALRGASAMLGFGEMSKLCRDLEDALRMAQPIDDALRDARQAAAALRTDIGEALTDCG